MTRRSMIALSAAAAAPLTPAQAAGGRLKQSAARWCYSKIPLDDLCREAARIGLKGIDLVNSDDWPTLKKYGLVPAMTPGAGPFPMAGIAPRTTKSWSAICAPTSTKPLPPASPT